MNSTVESENEPPPLVRGATRQDKIGTLGVCFSLIAVSVYLWFESLGYRDTGNADVGPGAVPRMVAIACAVVAVLLVIRTLRLPTVDAADEESRVVSVRVVAVVLVVALSVVLLPLIGYVVTMTALMVATGYLAGARVWWSNLLVSVLTTWLTLLLFSRVFVVPLPLGPLDRLLGG